MEYRRRAEHYSALMLADLITLPHFSVSSAISLAKSAGEPGSTVAPRLASLAWKLASARLALTCVFNVLMTSAGVFLGAAMPHQPLASEPGTNSPTVGRSGSSCGDRSRGWDGRRAIKVFHCFHQDNDGEV